MPRVICNDPTRELAMHFGGRHRRSRSRVPLPAVVLAAAGGYYLASLAGLELRLPPATTSIYWPPNAVLTSVLLLVPPRQWAVALLSALPVHVALQLQTGWPLSMVLALFVTNCSEALIAAGGMYLLSDAPTRFDTLRRLGAFLLAAVTLAPLLSSFGDAAAVKWFRGESYWHVWQVRTLSNMVTELTIVPAVVGAVTGVARWARPVVTYRVIEAAVLGSSLAALAWVSFKGTLQEIPVLHVLSNQTPLALQLPLLLWSALRFGPTGAGLTMLTSCLLGAWAISHGLGPFATLPFATTTTTSAAFAIGLLVEGTTLLCVATLIEERRRSQLTQAAIVQSLRSGVAVIDQRGLLVQANERWSRLAEVSEWMRIETGANMLDRCREAAARGDQMAGAVCGGIAGVLDGSREHFSVGQMHAADGRRSTWSTITAVRLRRPSGGALVLHDDVTELRRAEIEAQRSRQELAHVGRVSTVSEMTASLAHQLNQPLAAIMTNAQVAKRILDSERPDFDEVRAILRDIVADDRRASDVIAGLRTLLRKGEFEMTRVDLTQMIREVVTLVNSEAIIRHITIALDFAAEPVFVYGDRVQLQQVVLNLLHNAIEAMADQPQPQRAVVVECRPIEAGAVRVRVRDSGPGLHDGAEHLVFEPFYTTKPRGMGIGLSIVRSIVEAHGGSIRATNAGDHGAVFEFDLPTHVPTAA